MATLPRRIQKADDAFPSRLFDPLAVSVFAGYGRGLRVVHWDDHAARLFRRPSAEALGRPLGEVLTPPDAAPEARRAVRYVADTGQPWDGVLDVRRGDGGLVTVHTRLAPAWAGERVVGVVGIAVPLDREQRDSDLARYTLHDPLTGLANRVLLMDRLGQALARLPRSRGAVAVLFCDLDGFKEVNDRFGHDRGDELLVAIAAALRGAIRPGDTLARFGGDEFVVVCEGVQPGAEGDVARRLIGAVASVPPPDATAPVTVSVGVTVTLHVEADPDVLLRDADVAMYRAKRRGGARWELDLRHLTGRRR